MIRHSWFALCCLALPLLSLVGCRPSQPAAGSLGNSTQPPVYRLAWSEYPSWSVFGVADELGLLDGEEGKLGELEKKHNVDVVLQLADYGSCLNMFSAGNCEAACMTNMDALIVSPSRSAVAMFPTSTSNGADACLVTGDIADFGSLRGKPVYGAKGTVSEYCFVRCLEKAGMREADFNFTNQEPGTAALNMQQRAATHQAIMVWNPFVLQTLRQRSDVRVLFDSSQIPDEIVDMVVVGADVAQRPATVDFMRCISEAFYHVSDLAMSGDDQGNEVLLAIGRKFSNLNLEDMRLAVTQTKFYRTPSEAKKLLRSDDFNRLMQMVTNFCVEHQLVTDPSVGYGPDTTPVKLRFDNAWMGE